MYKLLLASKYPIIARALSAISDEAISEAVYIDKANSLVQMETMLTNCQPHMLILDIQMIEAENLCFDDMRSLDVLIKNYPLVKIIMLYTRVEVNFFKRMYLMGIKGIIDKCSTTDNFLTCIKTVYGNGIYVENKMLIDFLKVTQLQNYKRTDSSKLTLTKREKVIAKLLIEGKNNTQICTLLKLQPSTVSTFKHHVFKKLQVSNLLELERFKNVAV